MSDFFDDFKKIIGVYSPLQSRIMETLEANAIWVSGFGISHDRFGLPDLDIISYSEKVESQEAIIKSTSIPAIVDIDNGIYNKASFRKYITELSQSNPFGICIEDEKHPKISALYAESNGLMEPDEFIEYLKVIRKNSDSNIFARTNTLTRGESIRDRELRIEKLSDFGIDALVLHTKSFADLEPFCKKYHQRFNIYVITSLLDEMNVKDFTSIGVKGLILGHHMFFHNYSSQIKYAEELIKSTTIPNINNEARKQLNQLVNKRAWI